MQKFAIGITILLFGLCNVQAQSTTDKNFIEKLVEGAGSRQAGVNRINPLARKQSAAVDDWITRNRISIEGTRGGPFDPTSQYVTTFSSGRIYVHILDWSGKNTVALPSVIDRPVGKAWLLDGGAPVRVDSSPWGLTVVVPEEQSRNKIDTVVVLEMPGNIEELREPRMVLAMPSRPILLVGDTAKLSGSLHYSQGPDWIEGWTSVSDSVRWKVRVQSSGRYSLVMTYSCALGCVGARIEIMANKEKIMTTTQETSGVWRGWEAFEKRPIPGTLYLHAGVNWIKMEALNKGSTAEIIRLNSLSLSSLQVQHSMQLADNRARTMRADAHWLQNAKYGLMVHWLPNSMPQSGPKMEFCKAVGDFDAERFADMVKGTGAGYLVFTMAQLQYFAAPFRSVDEVLPSRTCKNRDLIGDLANALESRNIRLILYYHQGVGDTEWSRPAGFLRPDKSDFFHHEAAILSEAGQRYGQKLAGWWFDDRYPFQPFEQLDKAAKTGNPARIVAFNSWILPKSTEFQDFWAGEVGGDLNRLPDSGFFDHGGPASGLQPHLLIFLDDTWVHGYQDTMIRQPLYTDAHLIEYVKDCNRKGASVTMNIGVYQDGTASPTTLDQLVAVRRAVRGL
jgi:hypothetical protein